jgi:hypothetical protein
MTLLITFSWHFLLILVPERTRRLSWGVAPNPAKVGLGVRKCPLYLLQKREKEQKHVRNVCSDERKAAGFRQH